LLIEFCQLVFKASGQELRPAGGVWFPLLEAGAQARSALLWDLVSIIKREIAALVEKVWGS
jgi:hypothetical protein